MSWAEKTPRMTRREMAVCLEAVKLLQCFPDDRLDAERRDLAYKLGGCLTGVQLSQVQANHLRHQSALKSILLSE